MCTRLIIRIQLLMGFLFLFGSHTNAQNIEKKDTTVVETFEELPMFKTGMQGWRKFLMTNISLDASMEAIDSATYVQYGFKQQAVLEFTVCEDGEICDVEVVNKAKILPEFAKEALRVMKKSPKWTPAQKNGLPVRTRFRQIIYADLES